MSLSLSVFASLWTFYLISYLCCSDVLLKDVCLLWIGGFPTWSLLWSFVSLCRSTMSWSLLEILFRVDTLPDHSWEWVGWLGGLNIWDPLQSRHALRSLLLAWRITPLVVGWLAGWPGLIVTFTSWDRIWQDMMVTWVGSLTFSLWFSSLIRLNYFVYILSLWSPFGFYLNLRMSVPYGLMGFNYV